ncbi:permease [Priestia filamentosa]|uniref:permease n=1 Tax=Priestia filamentosa TaxID=1402861 RepID=UPI003D27E214
MALSRLSKEVLGVLLILFFGYAFFFLDVKDFDMNLPKAFLNVNTIFLSILLEAIPFILLGVFASAIIQVFVKEEWLMKWIPKNPYKALASGVIVSALLPVCECAIIPVVRRLVKKGMPIHVGVVLLVGAPILNPIVFLSTFYAFPGNKEIVYGRMGLTVILCFIIGIVMYKLLKNNPQLKDEAAVEEPHQHGNRLSQTLFHAIDEFFDMGKYLIAGAFIASLFQTFLDRGELMSIGGNSFIAPVVMMVFGYVLSLCSEADAFVASSFVDTFSASSLLAFLIYGPMLDLKNTVMYLAFFKKRFVLMFIAVVTISVYTITVLYNFIM